MPSNQRHSREPKIPDRIDTARPTVSFLFQATSRKVSAQLSTKFRSFFFKPIFLTSLACVVGLKSQQIIGGTVKQAGHLHENIGRDGRIPSNVGKVRLRGNSQEQGKQSKSQRQRHHDHLLISASGCWGSLVPVLDDPRNDRKPENQLRYVP